MKLFSFLVLASMAVVAARAQTSSTETDFIRSSDSGEVAAALLDVLGVETRRSKERVYVISRKGSLDTGKRIALGRLMFARQNRSVKGFDPATTVFAEGTEIEGEGRLEFYVGSNLRIVIFAHRNAIPNLTCCPDYFPPPKTKRKKVMRKS